MLVRLVLVRRRDGRLRQRRALVFEHAADIYISRVEARAGGGVFVVLVEFARRTHRDAGSGNDKWVWPPLHTLRGVRTSKKTIDRVEYNPRRMGPVGTRANNHPQAGKSLGKSRECVGTGAARIHRSAVSYPKPRQILALCGETIVDSEEEMRNRAYFHARDSDLPQKAGTKSARFRMDSR